MPIENPTIIIPGIKGSSLENFYALDPSPVWSEVLAAQTMVFGPTLRDLALDPTAKFDNSLQVLTRANGVLPLAYSTLASGLRQRRKLPVYVFPYDWRYSVEAAADSLAELMLRVHSKVSAQKISGWSDRIDFVCHSMGGLVFRSFLAKYPHLGHIGRVVFLAVPHQGSLDGVDAMIRGETTLFSGRKEMRKLARTFPGVYELLPRFADALVEQGTNKALDAFDVKNWQQNVTTHGPSGNEENGFDVEQHHLDDAKTVLNGLPRPTDKLPRGSMLTIYGARPGSTLTQVTVGPGPDRMHDFKNATKGTGDGVVPARSAVFPGIPAVRLTWDDVSYFTETSAAVSLHAFIGTLDETGTIIARFLDGGDTAADLLPRGLDANRYEKDPVAPL